MGCSIYLAPRKDYGGIKEAGAEGFKQVVEWDQPAGELFLPSSLQLYIDDNYNLEFLSESF